MTTCFGDIGAGPTRDCGSVTVGREAILGFGERYDPRSFHTDPEATAGSACGGLIAGGWQTRALTARPTVTDYPNDIASAGGRGIEDLRWRRPVRAIPYRSRWRLTERSDRDPRIGETDAEVTRADGDGGTALSVWRSVASSGGSPGIRGTPGREWGIRRGGNR